MPAEIISSQRADTNPTSLNVPANCTAIAVASIHLNPGAATPSGVTWDSVALEKKVDVDQANLAVAWWTLFAPAPGTFNLAWTGGAATGGLLIYRLRGVSRAIRAVNSNYVAAGNSITNAVTSKVGDLCLFACAGYETGSLSALLGMTLDWNYTLAAPDQRGAGHEAGAAGSTDAGFDGADTHDYGMVSIAFAPVRGAQIIMMLMRRFFDDLKRGLIPPQDIGRRWRRAYNI